MRSKRLLAAATLLVTLVVGCTTGHHSALGSSGGAPTGVRFPDPPANDLPPDKAAALQTILTRAAAAHAQFPDSADAVPGVTAAIVSDHGRWTGAAGTDGVGTTLTPDAMMGIASISKTFAAAEVLKLAAAGKIDLDAPLSRYIRHPLTRNGATVRQALGMVGGIPDFTEPEGTRLWHALVADCNRHWTMQQALAYQTAGTSAPGRSSAYSSPGYLLLGMVIEAVTGREPAASYRSDLFTPAGLSRISAQDRERPTAPLAAPAKNQAKLAADGFLPCRSVASSGGDAATGIAADAPTIAWWGYQLYGARLLPPDIAQAMMTPLAANEIFPGIQYGLGTMAFHVHFGVNDSFGHQGTQPGYNTLLAVVPALHISATVFIPDASKDPYPIMRNLLSVLQ